LGIILFLLHNLLHGSHLLARSGEYSGEKLESVIFCGDEDDTGESWQFCSKVFFEIFNALLE
jgi:hypothetical protein